MQALHHIGYWVDDLDSAMKQWGQDLGVGPFQVIEHVPFDSFVFTGTPAGVGNRRQPPRYLEPGQTLLSRFDGIGEIRQHFVTGRTP